MDPGFFKGKWLLICKRVVTLHFLITKYVNWELASCINFLMCKLKIKWGVTSHPFHYLDPPLPSCSFTSINWNCIDHYDNCWNKRKIPGLPVYEPHDQLLCVPDKILFFLPSRRLIEVNDVCFSEYLNHNWNQLAIVCIITCTVYYILLYGWLISHAVIGQFQVRK